ncbi:MAG: MarP family serine protease [Frankiaceae bacterium]|nr:MarP family serine protease [Frankiaceae bacterium]
MPGDLLDVVLAVAIVLFAISGYRQGFVVGVLSFVGFLGGGVVGAQLAPSVADWPFFVDFPRAVIGLAVVFLCASVGQVLATLVGGAVRRRITWHPVRRLDAFGGAAVSIISLLLVSWLVGRAVAQSPYPVLSAQVRGSVVIRTVDGLVPDGGQRLFTEFRQLVDEQGFPEVFDGLDPTRVQPVDPPDLALARSPVVEKVMPSVLKITGIAEDCDKSVEGTGFVYASERVMTNAHVVAGVDEPEVQVGDKQLPATVVLFDPVTDVAVLHVLGLDRKALPFAEEPAETGDGAVVVGYPQDGPFRADAARVRGTLNAVGSDIYGREQATREVLAIFSRVRPGNSGGPLVDPAGAVLGVIFAAAADDPQVGYALTREEVQDEAKAAATATERVSSQSCG